jgi:hypothetical protein
MDKKIREAYERLNRDGASICDHPELYKELARHILAMADDAYLTGHPEWQAIVDETINIAKK